jgi:predicted ATPase
MPLARRRALATLAARLDLQVIEDNPYWLLADAAPPPFARLARLARLGPKRVHYVSTLSKCLSPGLRAAFVVLPDAQSRAAFLAALRSFSLMLASLAAVLATQWLLDGTAQRVFAGMRAAACARQAIAAQSLAGALAHSHASREGIHCGSSCPATGRIARSRPAPARSTQSAFRRAKAATTSGCRMRWRGCRGCWSDGRPRMKREAFEPASWAGPSNGRPTVQLRGGRCIRFGRNRSSFNLHSVGTGRGELAQRIQLHVCSWPGCRLQLPNFVIELREHVSDGFLTCGEWRRFCDSGGHSNGLKKLLRRTLVAVKVIIKSLKAIKNLVFDVPMKGAFVITGANGCGKTSLLTVLHRMGAQNAFQTGLPGGKKTNGIDGIDDTAIEYQINGKLVIYRYNNTRWSATPRSNSTIIGKAFSEVLFLKADSSRVEPTQNDLKGVKKQHADPLLRSFMNAVFDTDRFDNLYRIRLQGRNLTAHLIDRSLPSDKKKTYYSEKTFSLGELCVMRLGQKLLAMKNGGLYIIDEFEMALHPAAQIRLFKQIEQLADAANCTALVSTHSSSLIKSVKRSNIIYLENDGGDVTIHRNVYPTYALQHLSLDEESAPDKLIFVEDIAAKHCLEAMWQLHIQRQVARGIASLPSVQTAVIGGFKEVLRFLERSSSFVPTMTRRMAALDADAEPICMPPSATASNPVPKLTVPQDLYHAQKSDVVFLPWTPEVGLCDLVRSDFGAHTHGIQNYTGITNLKVSQASFNAHVGKVGKEQRDACKQAIDTLATAIALKKTWPDERAKEALFAYLVQSTTTKHPQVMLQLSGKLFG